MLFSLLEGCRLRGDTAELTRMRDVARHPTTVTSLRRPLLRNLRAVTFDRSSLLRRGPSLPLRCYDVSCLEAGRQCSAVASQVVGWKSKLTDCGIQEVVYEESMELLARPATRCATDRMPNSRD